MNRMEGREKLKETNDQFSEQLSEGEKIQEEGEQSDRILQGMELDGLDSDTQQAAGEVLNEYSDTYNQAIGEVAEQVGFRSLCHFSREFKKEMGVTPSQYRSQNDA